MIFDCAALRDFFRKIKSLGATERFKDWQGNKVFLLRHDIDFDLAPAYRMAEIEAEEGVYSTIFVLVGCRTYNILHHDNRKRLREMIQMGHEIGLHFDPSIYGEDDLQAAADAEAEIVSFAAGEPVKSISLHNPSVYGQYPLFDGYVNAYDPAMFSDANYISDSCYNFRGKDPMAFIENITSSMIQVLLHPMHYSPSGGGYDEVIIEGIKRYIGELHDEFSDNATYRKQITPDLPTLFHEKSR